MAEWKSKQELEEAITKMVGHMQASPELQAKIGTSEQSIGFSVTDLGSEFVLKFADGQLSGGPGSASDATVSVALNSATLDKLFSGRLDPESAYSYGSLSLRGSEWVAQGMLRYMRDIVNAYKAVTAQ